MKKLIVAILAILLPGGAVAQTVQQYTTVASIAALKAMTNRPQVVEVIDANPGVFNLSQGACSAADDVFQVQPTSGTTVCYTRMATPFSAGKGSATSVLTSNGTLPSWSSTLPAVTANAAIATATGSSAARSLAARFGDVANVLDFNGVDPTGATDSAAAIQAAIDTGKTVFVPSGSYKLTANWLNFVTPGQKFICDGRNAVFTAVKPAGVTVSPMAIFQAAAVGASMEGCTFDHNGNQFAVVCGDGVYPQVPLAPLNTSCTGDALNAVLGTTVLVIADDVRINDTKVVRGWNVCIGIGVVDLTTGALIDGPYGGVITNYRTEHCGQGDLVGVPNYREGAGFDNFHGKGIQVVNGTDYRSQVGMYLDAGASCTIVNGFVSFEAQISPEIAGTWDNTLGGNGLWIGAQDRLNNGETWGAQKCATIVNNLIIVEPMRQCIQGFWTSTNSIINNVTCKRPGLQGVKYEGGMNRITNLWIDQANFLKGNTSVSPGTAAEQTNAIQVNGNNLTGVSDLYKDTDLVIDGLNVTNASDQPAKYAYVIGMTTVSGHVPSLSVKTSQVLDPGMTGMFTGNIEKLNLNDTLRTWTPTVYGGTTPGTPTYYEQTGKFWQDGKTTYLTFNVSTSSAGGAAGTINIGAIPKTGAIGSGVVGTCSVAFFNNYNFDAGYTVLGGQINAGGQVIGIVESGDAVAYRFADWARATGNGFRMAGSCQYATTN